jgi:hypothetical protein
VRSPEPVGGKMAAPTGKGTPTDYGAFHSRRPETLQGRQWKGGPRGPRCLTPPQSWSWSPFIESPPSSGASARLCRSGRLLALGALQATCKGLSPTREEHTDNPVQKPNCRGHAVPAVSKFEPGQGIPPFSLISASTRLSFQLNLGGCFLTSLPFPPRPVRPSSSTLAWR